MSQRLVGRLLVGGDADAAPVKVPAHNYYVQNRHRLTFIQLFSLSLKPDILRSILIERVLL